MGVIASQLSAARSDVSWRDASSALFARLRLPIDSSPPVVQRDRHFRHQLFNTDNRLPPTVAPVQSAYVHGGTDPIDHPRVYAPVRKIRRNDNTQWQTALPPDRE